MVRPDRNFTRSRYQFSTKPTNPVPDEGSLPAVSTVNPSGIAYVDYVDSGLKWATNSFTYSFPTSGAYYVGLGGAAYGSGEENAGFTAFNAVQQAATASILNMYSAVA